MNKQIFIIVLLLCLFSNQVFSQEIDILKIDWNASKHDILHNPPFATWDIFERENGYYLMGNRKHAETNGFDGVHFRFNEDNQLVSYFFYYYYKTKKATAKKFKSKLTAKYGKPEQDMFKNLIWKKDSFKIEMSDYSLNFSCIRSSKPVREHKLIFEDDFEDNKSVFAPFSGEWGDAVIKEGKLVLSAKKTNGYSITKAPFAFSDKKDFLLECKIKHAGGPKNYGFGVLIGFKDWDNYYSFKITASAQAIVENISNGDRAKTNWKDISSDLKSNEFNTLKIYKKNTHLEFYINDALVFRTAYRGLSANNFGFIIDNMQTIEIDDLKYYEMEQMRTENSEFDNMGLLIIYTSDPKLSTIKFKISPVLTLAEMKEVVEKQGLYQGKMGYAMAGHFGRLNGTAANLTECLPPTDICAITKIKDINEKNTVKGYNWSEWGIKRRVDENCNEGYYYAVRLPVGEYTIEVLEQENNSVIKGKHTVIVEKPCFIFRLRLN